MMKKVADWQIENPGKHPRTDWTQAVYYVGIMALYTVSNDAKYLDAMLRMGETNDWKPGPRQFHANDHAVCQTYCELYALKNDPRMIAPTVAGFNFILAHPQAVTAKGTDAKYRPKPWGWCDALFMAPPAWIHLFHLTGDKRYIEFMDKEWWATTKALYDPVEGLYFRDSRVLQIKTPSGAKTFWGRGNGWVYGALVRVLQFMPQDYPSRLKYLKLYREMTEAIIKTQQPDGLWRPSLLDPNQIPLGETSASGLFVYGLAWGVNNGLLDEAKYWPPAERGWNALVSKVKPSGMMGAVQGIGRSPGAVTDGSTEVYGTGAFLLAGSEVYKHLKH